MIMIVFDVLVTAYQGVLLLYVIKRQVMQPAHSVLYDIALVLTFTLFFAVIQYINLPVSENFVTMILFMEYNGCIFIDGNPHLGKQLI